MRKMHDLFKDVVKYKVKGARFSDLRGKDEIGSKLRGTLKLSVINCY